MTDSITTQEQPLFPRRKKDDRPLFIVFVILSFLATLTLLASASANRAAADWHTDLASSVTVQIKPNDKPGAAALARDILLQSSAVTAVTILPVERSKELLKPWLGGAALPKDLPLPILLDVRLHAGQAIDNQQISAAFLAANIRADIDDPQKWAKEIKRPTNAAQALSVTALVLIITACITAAVFATRAAITGQRRLIDVLHQVGAPPSYTARLFSANFALTGLKAGGLGAGTALLVSGLIGMMFASSSGVSFFLPGLHLTLTDIYLVIAVPILLAIIIAFASWRTIIKTLYEEIYP